MPSRGRERDPFPNPFPNPVSSRVASGGDLVTDSATGSATGPAPVAGATRGGALGGLEARFRRVVVRLVAATALLLLVGLAAVSILSVQTFEQDLLPEVEARARISGELAAAQVGRAMELGIPLESLVGMEEFLARLSGENASVAYLQLAGPDGEVLYRDGSGGATADAIPGLELSVPVQVDGAEVASMRVGMQGSEVPSILLDLRFDILTVLFVSLLIAFEFLLIFGLARLSAPTRFIQRSLEAGTGGDFRRFLAVRGQYEMGRIVAAYNAAIRRLNGEFGEFAREAEEIRSEQLDRSARKNISLAVDRVRAGRQFVDVGLEKLTEFRTPFDVRIAFFFFMVAQELSRPFLPLIFDRVYQPTEGLSREIVIGLPITGFMLAVLLVTPVAGALAERISPRSLFLAGVIPSVAGYLGTALSGDMFAAMTWWVVAGIGYGIIFITAQVYVAETADREHRAAGMAVFSGAAFAAFVCGPAIGGILADRLGYVNTLIVSGGLATASAIVAFLSLDGEPVDFGSERRQNGLPALHRVIALLSNRRFFSVAILSAIPAKIALTGVFFYLVPVYLHELGNTQSVIGRIMMVYGIACIVITPIAARYSDRLRRTDIFIAAGGLLGAFGCMIPAFAESSLLVLLGVGVLGIGHAMLTAPQLASVHAIAEELGPGFGLGMGSIVGLFRTIERVGTALGAILVATLVTHFGFAAALLATGGGALVLGALYILVEFRRPHGQTAAGSA